MWGVLILALAAGDSVTEAGASYRKALEELETERYEEAVQLLRRGGAAVGSESDELKYRDSIARRRHSYYPYYEMGPGPPAPGQAEPSIFTRRDLLKDAISRSARPASRRRPQLTEEVKPTWRSSRRPSSWTAPSRRPRPASRCWDRRAASRRPSSSSRAPSRLITVRRRSPDLRTPRMSAINALERYDSFCQRSATNGPP
jgi:hypothetical protein